VRYQDVIHRYLAVQEASSREWTISATLVMCLELDMSRDTYLTLALAAASSKQKRPHQFLRETLFRLHLGGITPVSDAELDEQVMIQQYRSMLDEWVMGLRDDLPLSTSSAITTRLTRRTL
jgi:hypothetical protein